MYLWPGLQTGLPHLPHSIRAVSDAEQREASIQPDPEDQVPKQLVLSDSRDPPDRNERDLRNLLSPQKAIISTQDRHLERLESMRRMRTCKANK